MKITEIRNMTIDELNEKLTDTSKKLSQLKFNNSVQTIENPLEIKTLRRQIAKLKTILNEKKTRLNVNQKSKKRKNWNSFI